MRFGLRARAIAALLMAMIGLVSTGCRRTLRLLDPLTPQEKAKAEQVARADPGVSKALDGGRTELVSIAFFGFKPDLSAAAPDPNRPRVERAAEVIFYRFDDDSGIRVIVRLAGNGSVAGVQPLEGPEVPLSGQDWNQALAIALKDEKVANMLSPNVERFRNQTPSQSAAAGMNDDAVRILVVRATDARDPCYHKRCVQLLFQHGGGFLADTAIVNLFTGMVEIQKGQPSR